MPSRLPHPSSDAYLMANLPCSNLFTVTGFPSLIGIRRSKSRSGRPRNGYSDQPGLWCISCSASHLGRCGLTEDGRNRRFHCCFMWPPLCSPWPGYRSLSKPRNSTWLSLLFWVRILRLLLAFSRFDKLNCNNIRLSPIKWFSIVPLQVWMPNADGSWQMLVLVSVQMDSNWMAHLMMTSLHRLTPVCRHNPGLGRQLKMMLLNCAAQLGAASSTVVAFHTAEPLAALVFVLVTLVIVFKVFLTSAVFNLNPQVMHVCALMHHMMPNCSL